jgi:hypothetical protein
VQIGYNIQSFVQIRLSKHRLLTLNSERLTFRLPLLSLSSWSSALEDSAFFVLGGCLPLFLIGFRTSPSFMSDVVHSPRGS